MAQIETVGVLGAGIMGGGIAAHLASCGIRVHLLDIVPPKLSEAEKKDPKARNGFAGGALKKMPKTKPAPFYDVDALKLITAGNFDDHLERLAECDLVIEAVIENLDIKKSLFEKVAPHLKDDVILASNTSGLSIAKMNEVLPQKLKSRFLVMHFFNPVRYMRLLELVPGPDTASDVMERAAAFGEYVGKGIVYGKDTANFVANRIGIYGMMGTMRTMAEDGYRIEEVDKIVAKPMGRAAGPFKTGDLVGIDTFAHVAQNCYDSLVDDEERDIFKLPEWVRGLVDKGMLGRKTKGGFFKKDGKDLLVYDVEKGEYRTQEKFRYDSLGAAKKEDDVGARVKGMVWAEDRAGQFAWKVTARSLAYAARRLGEIADDIVNIDRAMRWGFNWEMGPFETWDAIGVPDSVARMKNDGVDVPAWVTDMLESGQKTFYEGDEINKKYWDPQEKAMVAIEPDPQKMSITVLKADKTNKIADKVSASLVDLGDGVLCLEVHSKMNTIDDDVGALMVQGVEEAEKNFEALVVGNDGEHFGAGANIMPVVMAANQGQWDAIEKAVRGFQSAVMALRYARVPVVAAPFGYTFGGACEIVMACDAVQAFAETYIGLVEIGVGLLPAGAGCTRVVDRFTTPLDGLQGVEYLQAIGQGFMQIATAAVGTGAEEGRRLRYLRPTDGISLTRDHLLYHAKQRALGMARAGYRPPRPPVFKAVGYDAAKTINVQAWGMIEGGWATEHDIVCAKKVGHVLCGGNAAAGTELSEQHYLDLEREAFVSLCGEEKTRDRMQHMLMKGKPLRN